MKRDTAAVQAGLARLARQMQALERQAKTLHRTIPASPGRAAMQEDEIAPDVATDLVAAIECLVTDCLKPGLRIAREASRLTEAKLKHQWRSRQRKRGEAVRCSEGDRR